MTKQSNYEYIIPEYFQKTSTFLVPLVGIVYPKIKRINSYCYTNIFDDNIDTGHIIVEYEIKEELSEEELIRLRTELYVKDLCIKNNKLYICYDILSDHVLDYDAFMQGEYSSFTYESKNKIMSFYKKKQVFPIKKGDKINKSEYVLVSLLQPSYFKDEIIEELIEYTGCDHIDFKDFSELASKFDKEKETLIL